MMHSSAFMLMQQLRKTEYSFIFLTRFVSKHYYVGVLEPEALNTSWTSLHKHHSLTQTYRGG